MSYILKTLEVLTEGRSKRAAEDEVEKLCNCDGGMSLDADEHDKGCPARKKIEKGDFGSDAIDAAEYRMGDR
jgi:hypothetical protein